MSNKHEKWFLTVEETAELLRMRPKSIYNRTGRRAKSPFPIKHKKVGKRVLFDIRDLEAFRDSL